MKLAPSVRQISIVPRPAAILSAWYLSFVKLNGHCSITQPACAGVQNCLAMNLAQRFDLLTNFRHEIVDYSRGPPFSPRAYKSTFIEMMGNPFHRFTLSLKLGRFFPQWNSGSRNSVRLEPQFVLDEPNSI